MDLSYLTAPHCLFQLALRILWLILCNCKTSTVCYRSNKVVTRCIFIVFSLLYIVTELSLAAVYISRLLPYLGHYYLILALLLYLACHRLIMVLILFAGYRLISVIIMALLPYILLLLSYYGSHCLIQIIMVSLGGLSLYGWLLSCYYWALSLMIILSGSYGSDAPTRSWNLGFYYHFACMNLAFLLSLLIMEHGYLLVTYVIGTWYLSRVNIVDFDIFIWPILHSYIVSPFVYHIAIISSLCRVWIEQSVAEVFCPFIDYWDCRLAAYHMFSDYFGCIIDIAYYCYLAIVA